MLRFFLKRYCCATWQMVLSSPHGHSDSCGDKIRVRALGHQGRHGTALKQTRDDEPMLVECWADVADGGPTFNQHRFTSRSRWDQCRALIAAIM